MLRFLIAIVMLVVLWRVGFWMLRMFGQAPPPPPPPGEMRRIKMNYRCSICGAEARMTRAQTEDPEPPRHCMEDMEYVPGEDD